MVVAKPDGLSWVKAASIPENWLTAWQALFWIGEMKKGQSVLIHAGCSGVGLAAIQLAKAFGAGIIISTAGTDEKVKFVAQHGAIGINYKTQDFSAEVLKLTSDLGVNLVVDFIGADYWTKNITSMAKEGHMVLLGLMGGSKTEGPLDLLPILFKRLRIEGILSLRFYLHVTH
jgi:NADPH:quinone reductase-like Zn-dependent oxidoreductase